MNAYAIDNGGLWAVARMLFEAEQAGGGFPFDKAPGEVQMKYRHHAQTLCWEYAASLALHPQLGAATEVSVGLVDAPDGMIPDCEVCTQAARGYVVDEGAQRFACLGHLGILAGSVMAYGSSTVVTGGRP